MTENLRLATRGNLAFLVTACAAASLLVTILSPLSYPLSTLWVRSCSSLISSFGVSVVVDGPLIELPALGVQFIIWEPRLAILLFVKTLMGLVMIAFFFIQSVTLKWTMFLLAVPASVPVAILPIAVSILIGFTISPDAGVYVNGSYHLSIIAHLTLASMLGIFATITSKKQRLRKPC